MGDVAICMFTRIHTDRSLTSSHAIAKHHDKDAVKLSYERSAISA